VTRGVAVPPEVVGKEWRLTPAGYGDRLSRGAWESAPHLELLSRKFVETAMGANKRRLAVSMPPRHGKSEHGLYWAPIWYEDMMPRRSLAIVTYGAEFSQQWTVKIRDTLDEIAKDPRASSEVRLRIRRDARRASHLVTTGGGDLYALGTRGQLTGRGVHALLIDDPHKDWEEANSIVYRDKVWNWYTSTARTRLDPVRSGPRPFVVVTATRWHEDDLIGRLIEQQGKIEDGGLWEVINLPAIADENDPLGRAPGEALWPEMYPLDLLLETKDEVGPYVWDALYQGNPSPPEGTILLRQWWKWYDRRPSGLDVDATFMSWDMSFKDSEGSDFVVGQVWAIVGSKRFLLDQVKDRMSFTKACDEIRRMKSLWPMASTIYIEDTANGPAVIDALSDEIPGIVPVTPQGSKVSRAHAVTGLLKAGNVWIPKPALAPWIEDFVRECAVFPQAPNDDQVDAFTQAMIESGAASGVTLGSYRPGQRAGAR
jgi:predicted phage terminase large subunit-like protein